MNSGTKSNASEAPKMAVPEGDPRIWNLSWSEMLTIIKLIKIERTALSIVVYKATSSEGFHSHTVKAESRSESLMSIHQLFFNKRGILAVSLYFTIGSMNLFLLTSNRPLSVSLSSGITGRERKLRFVIGDFI